MAVDYKTKFLIDFEIDDDSITAANAPEMGATAAYVMRHVNVIAETSTARHIFIVDNYYTSIPLAKAVLGTNNELVGTMRKDRGVPTCAQFAGKKPTRAIPKGTVLYSHDPAHGIHVYGWMDHGSVYILDTAYGPVLTDIYRRNGAQREMFRVPLACKEYNANMGGVDAFDYRRCTNYGWKCEGAE